MIQELSLRCQKCRTDLANEDMATDGGEAGDNEVTFDEKLVGATLKLPTMRKLPTK